MAADDFGAQLGSMDRNQLKELMAYLSEDSVSQRQVGHKLLKLVSIHAP